MGHPNVFRHQRLKLIRIFKYSVDLCTGRVYTYYLSYFMVAIFLNIFSIRCLGV